MSIIGPEAIKNLGGTKFIATIFALTGSMIGACWGWLSGAEWVASVNITLTLFVGSRAYTDGKAIQHGAADADRG